MTVKQWNQKMQKVYYGNYPESRLCGCVDYSKTTVRYCADHNKKIGTHYYRKT